METFITREQINFAPTYFGEVILNDLNDYGVRCWVSGGALTNYFLRKNANDYDLYFPDQQNLDRAISYFQNNGAVKTYESKNGVKYTYNGEKFDLIKMFYNRPEDTINSFDITVCMFAVDENGLYSSDSAIDDFNNRRINYNKISSPEVTLKRTNKYQKRGFRLLSKDSKKLLNLIKNMPKGAYIKENNGVTYVNYNRRSVDGSSGDGTGDGTGNGGDNPGGDNSGGDGGTVAGFCKSGTGYCWGGKRNPFCHCNRETKQYELKTLAELGQDIKNLLTLPKYQNQRLLAGGLILALLFIPRKN